MSTGEEEALAAVELEHAGILLAELARVCRLRILCMLLVATVTSGGSIEVMEDLVTKISGTRTDNITGIVRRLEDRAAIVVGHLLRVGVFTTSITRHLVDDAASLLKNTLVIKNCTGLAACSPGVVLLIVESIITVHESRVQQIVVFVHLGRSLLLEKLLDVLGFGRRHIPETVASLILAGCEEASVFIEVPVDLLDLGHLPTRHCLRAKTAIS